MFELRLLGYSQRSIATNKKLFIRQTKELDHNSSSRRSFKTLTSALCIIFQNSEFSDARDVQIQPRANVLRLGGHIKMQNVIFQNRCRPQGKIQRNGKLSFSKIEAARTQHQRKRKPWFAKLLTSRLSCLCYRKSFSGWELGRAIVVKKRFPTSRPEVPSYSLAKI